jgi:hypothetical protein
VLAKPNKRSGFCSILKILGKILIVTGASTAPLALLRFPAKVCNLSTSRYAYVIEAIGAFSDAGTDYGAACWLISR